MHDQLKPDGLIRRNNDILRLTADALHRIAAGGYVEDGVSKIICYFLSDDPAVRSIDDCYLVPRQSGLGFSVFLDQLPRNRFHRDMSGRFMAKSVQLLNNPNITVILVNHTNDGPDRSQFSRILSAPTSRFYTNQRSCGPDRLHLLQAPDSTLPDLDGTLHSLSGYRCTKVQLMSWASW